MTNRDRLYQLVDCLPEAAVPEAERVLEQLQAGDDPLLRTFLNAPIDDETLTTEEIIAIEEGKAEIARGEGIRWEVVRARLLSKE